MSGFGSTSLGDGYYRLLAEFPVSDGSNCAFLPVFIQEVPISVNTNVNLLLSIRPMSYIRRNEAFWVIYTTAVNSTATAIVSFRNSAQNFGTSFFTGLAGVFASPIVQSSTMVWHIEELQAYYAWDMPDLNNNANVSMLLGNYPLIFQKGVAAFSDMFFLHIFLMPLVQFVQPLPICP